MKGRPHPQTPCPDMTVAVLCLLLSAIVLPGLGTVVGAATTGERGALRGVAQFLLAFILVGWVWGIVTGVQMVRNAAWKQASAPRRHFAS